MKCLMEGASADVAISLAGLEIAHLHCSAAWCSCRRVNPSRNDREKLFQFQLIKIRLVVLEAELLVELIGRDAFGVRCQVNRADAQSAGVLDAGFCQRLTDALAALGFIHDDIFDPGFQSAGDAEHGQGRHADDCLVSLTGEEEACGAGGEHFVQFGQLRRGDSSELCHQTLHGAEEFFAGLAGLFEMDVWVHGNSSKNTNCSKHFSGYVVPAMTTEVVTTMEGDVLDFSYCTCFLISCLLIT